MDLFYWIGLLVVLYAIACLVLVIIADSDIITFFYDRYGKKPETEYRGKVVWVTGASSGIGEALAKELAKHGAKIVISARRKNDLERVKKDCLQSSSLKDNDVLVLPLDVTDLKSHEPALKKVLDHFKKLDILVSNAGQAQNGDFFDIDMQVDKHIFEVNVFGVINMNRLVVKHFLERGGGHVVVVSSLAGIGPGPFMSSYTASKHAIMGYFNSMRMELHGKNINVTLICPGPVSTPILSNQMGTKVGDVVVPKLPSNVGVMTSQRCAHLALVSIANRLNESWMAKLPVLPFIYLNKYMPLVSDLFFHLFGKKMLEEMKK